MSFHPAFSTPHVYDPDAATGTPHSTSDGIVCVICGADYPEHSDTAHAPVWAMPDGTEPSNLAYVAALLTRPFGG